MAAKVGVWILGLGVWAATTTCDSPAGPADVVYVQVTPATWNPTALGDTVRFIAVGKSGLHGPIPNLPVTWSSDPPNVMFVDQDGSAVAQENGVAQVRATIDGVTGTATVRVVQTIESVVILTYFGNTISTLGDSIFLYIDARDRNAFSVPGTRFTLESLNRNVATVTLDGWVKAVSPGVADIVAMAAGKADTAPVLVVP